MSSKSNIYIVEIEQQDGSFRECYTARKRDHAYAYMSSLRKQGYTARVKRIKPTYKRHGFDYDFDD